MVFSALSVRYSFFLNVSFLKKNTYTKLPLFVQHTPVYTKSTLEFYIDLSKLVHFADKRLSDFDIAVTDTAPPAQFTKDQICAYQKETFQGQKEFLCQGGGKTGRYVVIQLRARTANGYLTLCDVGIMQNSEF